MAISPGSQIWRLRSADRTGNPAIYRADTLLNKFADYWDWVHANPLTKSVLGVGNQIVEIPIGRPMSVKGFCLFAGIAQNTFYGYANNPDYYYVCELIKDAIYTQKFEGASVGIFSAQIMTRDLGLSDTVTHVLDDKRKTIAELFPADDEILAIEAGETDIETIKKLNSE